MPVAFFRHRSLSATENGIGSCSLEPKESAPPRKKHTDKGAGARFLVPKREISWNG